MSSIALRDESEMIRLHANHIDRLIQTANSDAALLYLALVRASGSVSKEELKTKLRWNDLRLDTAESILQDMGLIERPKREKVQPAEERTEYTREEIADMVTSDDYFRMLIDQIEAKWGKHLSTEELRWLANLHHDQGLSADVIYLLVNHCLAESERKFGENRKPTFRAIWKEGCFWVEHGISSQEQASDFIRIHAEKQSRVGEYMRALQLGDRLPVASEEKYILEWMEKGFTPDAVALAYDKTIFYKKELVWNYLNGILRRWEKEGWHTAEQVQAADSGKAPKKKNISQGSNSWMSSYTGKKR